MTSTQEQVAKARKTLDEWLYEHGLRGGTSAPETALELLGSIALAAVSANQVKEAETFARYHDERAGHGGAGWEFHARAASYLRVLAERTERAEEGREILRAALAGEQKSHAASLSAIEAALSSAGLPGLGSAAERVGLLARERDSLRHDLEGLRGRLPPLELHLADLEKSLEAARKERRRLEHEVAEERDERKRLAECAAVTATMEARRERDEARADNAAVLAFVAGIADARCDADGAINCGECIPCLARSVRDDDHLGAALLEQHRKELLGLAAERDAAQRERDAAVADNAALLAWINDHGHRIGARLCPCTGGYACEPGCAAHTIHVQQPHSGGALLEAHRKEILGLTAERDTLRAEVDRLKRMPSASLNDDTGRIAALEQHISALEKSLEDSRLGLSAWHGKACSMAPGPYPENAAECEDERCRAWRARLIQAQTGAPPNEEALALRESRGLLQKVAKVARGLAPVTEEVRSVLGTLIDDCEAAKRERDALLAEAKLLKSELSAIRERATNPEPAACRWLGIPKMKGSGLPPSHRESLLASATRVLQWVLKGDEPKGSTCSEVDSRAESGTPGAGGETSA